MAQPGTPPGPSRPPADAGGGPRHSAPRAGQGRPANITHAFQGAAAPFGSGNAAAALALSILPISVAAQDSSLLKLLVRTEGKHLQARQNLEQILRQQPQFWVELQAVAARLETHPEWLLNVMASESLFVAGARNRLPGQTASGLLQIIEDTAQGLGTTTAAIR